MKSSTTLAALVAHCRKLTRRQQRPDAELLRRLFGQHDHAAFEELLERYAPLVWGVCRRVVSNEADCEDAFQAVFLTLFRKAAAIDPQRPLGAWLHGVAVRAAHKAAAHSARQPTIAVIPERATSGDCVDELGNRELFRVVDEEIARLPALLREPFVLCCLEGRTRDEAAMALNCSVGAIKGRLERSRDFMRKRLEQRGFGLPAAFLVLGLTGEHVRAALRAKALQCVFGSAPATVAALVPAAGVSLASKLTLTALSLVVVGVLGFGAFHVMQAEPPEDAPAQAKGIAPQAPVAEKPSPRVDRFGDPLPPGAIRRFGTLRLRHNYLMLHLAFTPDSKQLIGGIAPRPLVVFDAATGRRLRTIGKSTGGNHYGFAISPDGRRIVCGVSGALWDLQTGKLIRELADGSGQWSCVAFSPDGNIVAAAKEHQAEIVTVEADTGKQLVHQTLKPGRAWPPQYSLNELAFSPDREFLATIFCEMRVQKDGGVVVGMEQVPSQIWLLDAAKGAPVRTFGSNEDAMHSIAFQPGTGRLAAVGKDGAIRFWDVKTGKEVHRIAAVRKDETRGILRFLDSGRQCALTCSRRSPQSAFRTEAAFLTIVDAKDGRELKRIKLGEDGWPMALSPDGRTVATGAGYKESCVRIWDVETGAERFADAGHRAAATLSLSADGRTLISRGGEGCVIHWDLRTGNNQVQPAHAKKEDGSSSENLAEWSLHGPRWQLIFHDKTSEMEVRSRDGAKLLRKVKWPSTNMEGALLSPDGTHLAVPVHDKKYNSALLWDPEGKDEPHKLVGPPSSPTFNCSQKLLFTHDSKRLLLGRCTPNPSPPNFLWVWDVATPKIVRRLPIKFAPVHLVLSSDDRVLLSATGWHNPTVHVWDMETGKEKTTLTDPLLPPMEPGKEEWDRYVSSLLLSPDERFLVVVTHRGDSSGISVWDTAAWKTVRTFPWTRLENRPHSMIFSRAGRSLFVANSDTTILEWDVSGQFGRSTETPNRHRLNTLWRTLAQTPDKAYPAVWEMLDHPAESVPYLIDKLSPVKPIEEKRVRQLLARLDSESFAEREEASQQLVGLGEQILPMLRLALKGGRSLEMRKRIEGAIDSLTCIPAPEQLRLLRALAVLEWSSRPEAVEHLRKLAGGAPSASLTRAAKAAWQRLKH
jgi:RNA polymerase sigma factor (sigma-70 family)